MYHIGNIYCLAESPEGRCVQCTLWVSLLSTEKYWSSNCIHFFYKTGLTSTSLTQLPKACGQLGKLIFAGAQFGWVSVMRLRAQATKPGPIMHGLVKMKETPKWLCWKRQCEQRRKGDPEGDSKKAVRTVKSAPSLLLSVILVCLQIATFRAIFSFC